jgi:hypothetical protein
MQMFIVIGMFYALHRNKNKIFEWKKCALRNKICRCVEEEGRKEGGKVLFYRSFKESCKLEHNNFTNLNFMER